MSTTSILVVLERIYGYQFNSNHLKIDKSLVVFRINAWNWYEIDMFWKENKPHTESISEIIDSEISAYLNA